MRLQAECGYPSQEATPDLPTRQAPWRERGTTFTFFLTGSGALTYGQRRLGGILACQPDPFSECYGQEHPSSEWRLSAFAGTCHRPTGGIGSERCRPARERRATALRASFRLSSRPSPWPWSSSSSTRRHARKQSPSTISTRSCKCCPLP